MTLPCDRVAHACFGASLVAVTPPAVGVVVEARGAEVTLPPYDIGLAPGWDTSIRNPCFVLLCREQPGFQGSPMLAGTQCR